MSKGQINTWNQNRQDRIQEQQILVELLNEYENNLTLPIGGVFA